MCVSKKRRKKKNKNLKKNKMTKNLTVYDAKVVNGVPVLEIEPIDRNNAISLMRSIFEVQSVSGYNDYMHDFIVSFIKDLNDDTITYSSDEFGNMYVTKGRADTYPCIVSHIDTVHSIIPQYNYVVLNSDTQFFAVNTLTRGATGIGGDDKNGIFCCLDNLISQEKIKLAFFVDEEIGCVGSTQADMTFFEDVSFVLQADRQGYKDVAIDICYTEMFGVDFYAKIQDTLDDHNRSLCEGGMTDVMQLAHNGLEVAMANFSCGYYKPHSDYEYVVIDELILTSILFSDIIKNAYVDGDINHFEREVNEHAYYGGYGGYGRYDSVIDKVEQADDYNLSSQEKVTVNQ